MDNEDRLSNLPEDLLCNILSFLPTKNAIATSVLSKEWKSLWRSLLILDFDDDHNNIQSKENLARFVESVSTFIQSRDHHQPIHKLRLRFSTPRDYQDHINVRACVDSAMQLLSQAQHDQVQHLEIALPFPGRVELCDTDFLFLVNTPQSRVKPPKYNMSPATIFCCTNLVVLKLEAIIFVPPISLVNLPFLKTLHVQDMIFQQSQCFAQPSDGFTQLLSGCPVLEDLKAIRAFGRFNMLWLPKLVRAEISGNYGVLLNAVSNVKYLNIHEIQDTILLSEKDINRVRDSDGRTYPSVFPMFHNLIHIELSYQMFNKDWLEVVELLKHCPQLQVLAINQRNFHRRNVVRRRNVEFESELRDGQCPQSVPECILLHLKRCYLNDYKGSKGEFEFARYIMQNGRVLESMTICSGADVDQQEKLENQIELSSCTRQSATCKLFF